MSYDLRTKIYAQKCPKSELLNFSLKEFPRLNIDMKHDGAFSVFNFSINIMMYTVGSILYDEQYDWHLVTPENVNPN